MGIYRLTCKEKEKLLFERFFRFQKKAKEIASSSAHENLKWVKTKEGILSKDAELKDYKIEPIGLE